ncbi:MAG: excinuclease ABC subunit UvrC [Candidatus Cloacimonetes bacterium]|nr:excinuclease ABC subunit UvrC [Candidatus Cloacimonadota bacterium]
MAEYQEALRKKLELLPALPGCYLMKDKDDKIIYVGKAKLLKNRVRSYFNNSAKDIKTTELVERIRDFDYIIVNTEKEALVLENNLIKAHQPRYNVALRDDKQFPFIAVTSDAFPRIFVTRVTPKDGSHYFGPFTDVRALRRTLRLLEWVFPYRTCKRKIIAGENRYKKACINYQMGKCPAPCIGKISEQEYSGIISSVLKFLDGRNEEVISDLSAEMLRASEDLRFEDAGRLRDKIESIRRVNRKRTLFFDDQKNRDVIGIYKEDTRAAIALLKIVEGKLLAKETYKMKNVEKSSEAEIMNAFLSQYYESKLDRLPWRILLQLEPDDYEYLNGILLNKLIIPQRGESMKLVKIAADNAFNRVEEEKLLHLRSKNRTIFPVKDLKDKLNLTKLPRKMICIDISNIQGTDVVASLVYFENGKPKKKNYRNFIIRSFTGQNDFAAMKETMERYFSNIEPEVKPDLIVIDGGKGQLSSAMQILAELDVNDIEIISLAKRVEEVFLPDHPQSIFLPRSSSALRLLVQIRDASHNAAVGFHRKRRQKRTLRSELDDIAGIGSKTRFLLLRQFGSVEGVKQASKKDLLEIKGIGNQLADKILAGIKKGDT